MIKATIQFDNGNSGNWRTGRNAGWAVTKVFNDQAHMDNFIASVERKTGMPLDEVWIIEKENDNAEA